MPSTAPDETAPTLTDVFDRLEALERENQALRAELAVLADAMRGARASAGEPPIERLSRRWLLRRGMQAAAVTVAAGMLVQRESQDAAANHTGQNPEFDTVTAEKFIAGSTNGSQAFYAVSNGTIVATIMGFNNERGGGVYGSTIGVGYGVQGVAPGGTGVYGDGLTVGVKGTGGTGVVGTSATTDAKGVHGEHTGTSGYGVVGDGKGGISAGVLGRNPAGFGVRGDGYYGVAGYSSANGSEAMYAGHTGTAGWGIVADGKGPAHSGVLGRNSAGVGVRGDGATGVHGYSPLTYGVFGENTAYGHGVQGTSAKGYGGQFKGGKAPLRLVPRTTVGAPASAEHFKGELVVDAAATLWICIADGTPGTWKRVTVS